MSILRWSIVFTLLVGALASAAFAMRDQWPITWTIRAKALVAGIKIDHGIRIVMPDGVSLATSMYIPRFSSTRLPTVLIRLPYDRLRYESALGSAIFFARHGYAVLVQDVRGKFESEGEFAPWEKATSDGAATLDWIVRQPWSNGKVGTFGCSALGEMQYSLARAQHPALAAMIPTGAGGAWGSPRPSLDQGGFYEGGILQLASAFGWSLQHGARDPKVPLATHVDIGAALNTLPLVEMVSRLQPGHNVFTDYLRLTPSDAGWRRFDLVMPDDRIAVPTLDMNTWGDQTIDGTLALTEMARRQSETASAPQNHVVIAPGNHCDHIGTMDTGKFGVLAVANTSRPYGQWFLRHFDRHLKGVGDGLSDLPPYQFYVIGEDRWLSAAQWPPEASRVERWFLGSGGRANSSAGDGTLGPAPNSSPSQDHFVADPQQPVPTRGGPLCCTGNPADVAGPTDQADVERRQDVLVYTSGALDRPLRIAGTLRARLTVSSSAPDTDLVARLTHVWPDGRSTSIQEGALRMRYRSGPNRAASMQPGQRYVVEVPMRSIAYRVPAGHRIRLHVTGSSFPRLERNLNTGGNNFDEVTGVIAHNTVHHSGDTVSYLELPVLDDAQAKDAP